MTQAPNKNLEAAAKALVRAACMEVDCVTQQNLVATLDALKQSFDSKLNTVTQSVNTVNQHLSNLQAEMSDVKALLKEQKKLKRLEMVMKMTDLKAFDYWYAHSSNNTRNSSEFVKTVLKWFVLGYGFNFPVEYHIIPSGTSTYLRSNEQKREHEKAFRKELVAQLKALIGHEPRLVDNGNNSFSVYYE